MLDDLLGDGSSGYSSNYKGGLLSKTLFNEGTSLFYSRVDSADAESYPERFPIAMKDIAEEFRRVGGDDSLNLHDMFIASLQTIDTHIADEYYENYGWAPRLIFRTRLSERYASQRGFRGNDRSPALESKSMEAHSAVFP